MDLSEQFFDLLQGPGSPLSRDELIELKNRYQIIFLRGLMGDLVPDRVNSYFLDQMQWLQQHEINHWRPESNSEYGMQKLSRKNIGAIERTILNRHQMYPDKNVILVSHSKGGIDALETLLARNYLPGTHVRGWIAMQTPFSGTPISDWVIRNRLLNPVTQSLLAGPFKGDRNVALNMGTQARVDYIRRNAAAIRALAKKCNILSFASRISPADRSIFRPLRYALDRICNLANDGLIPTESHVLSIDGIPCCPWIEANHLDHIYTVLPVFPDRGSNDRLSHKHRRIRIFASLLKIWMNNRSNQTSLNWKTMLN